MRIAGSNRFYLNPSEKESLARMARSRKRGADGDNSGESSSDSLEEISAEDFNQEGRGGAAGSRSRGWMEYEYPVMPRNYASNLYSIAWAQAVQDKPLEFNLNKNKQAKEEAPDNVVIEDSSEEAGDAAEKEEGELEEGEIGFGSETVDDNEMIVVSSDKPENAVEEKESDQNETEEISDFDRRVSIILEELETVTVEEAEASFEVVCTRLRKSFENLKPMCSESESSDTVLCALVQQAFMGIQTVYSVLSSDNLKNKGQNKDLLLRLLIHIKNQYSILLAPDQINEMDTLVNQLVFEDREKVLQGDESRSNANNTTSLSEVSGVRSRGLVPLERSSLEPKLLNSYSGNSGVPGLSKLELSSSTKTRPQFGLLVDLHANYDTDNLPSPTRENPPGFPMPKPIGYGIGPPISSPSVTPKNVDKETTLQHYAKDAVKAVSSYQQKWTNFPANNRLPSPTPSEECNNEDDSHGEVSSTPVSSTTVSSTMNTANNLNQLKSAMPGSNSTCTNNIPGDQPALGIPIGKVGSGANHINKSTSKSRDPRLRFISPKAVDSMDLSRRVAVDSDTRNNGLVGGTPSNRKHKQVDDSAFADHSKRQRNGLTSSVYTQIKSGGRWLDGSNTSDRIRFNENPQIETKRPGNGDVGSDGRPDATTDHIVRDSGYKQNLSTNPASISLPSLLRAVNPTALVQLLQLEQQRLALENQQKIGSSKHDILNVSTVNGLPGSLPSANSASLKSIEAGANPAEKPQVPASTAHTNPQIRLKPRDPRRALHNNLVQKNEILGSEHAKNGAISSDIQSNMAREQVQQALPSASKPDSAQLLPTHHQNLVDAVSRSQVTTIPPSVNISQSILHKRNQMEVKIAAPELNDSKKVISMAPEGSTAGNRQSANPWGDVDHLLDGYDDEQKAAIQKERARRIEEQNKMFAARKLCLVLDLDHTLLNSAKFLEIDPVHEEILRKKEEQDREKPQRQLFRFQHMGMWTKLRPGIWNFLEKASKLYELHLYTMGNKLYATEMAKVLDPTGNLFSGRVMSRGDDSDPSDGDERVPKSKDLDGVLGMESAVVIIDDSVKVWPHNKLNLIVVERYTYFPCSRRQFGLPGPSLLEIDHDERPEEGTLASSLAVIERIHQIFFSHRSLNDVDVRNILGAEQRKILAGCRIVFSRIFPVGEANPHLHPLWQMAEQFGAVCTNQIDEQVTHVVANSLGTDKVNWALSTGRFVVQPGWVEASALLYRRANEHDFAIKL